MAAMGHWSGVLRVFDDLVRDQEKARRERIRTARARAEFAAWCGKADDRLFEEIKAALEIRAETLAERYGVRIDVRYPSDPPVVTQGGGGMRFLRAALGATEVHVYSSREPGTPPMVHYAHVVQGPHERFPRLISMPGFIVSRGPEGETVLRACGHTAAADPVSADDVACSVLEMLGRAALATRQATGAVG